MSQIKIGGPVSFSCDNCGTELKEDPTTGNYKCPNPKCDKKSHMTSSTGMTTTVDEHGNVTIATKKDG